MDGSNESHAGTAPTTENASSGSTTKRKKPVSGRAAKAARPDKFEDARTHLEILAAASDPWCRRLHAPEELDFIIRGLASDVAERAAASGGEHLKLDGNALGVIARLVAIRDTLLADAESIGRLDDMDLFDLGMFVWATKTHLTPKFRAWFKKQKKARRAQP